MPTQPEVPATPVFLPPGAADTASPQTPFVPRRKAAKRGPSFLGSPAVRAMGHIFAAALGLGCGYFLLRWLRPDLFPW